MAVFKEGNPVNSLFNYLADRAADYVDNEKRRLDYPKDPSGFGINADLELVIIDPPIVIVKAAEALASLSASITGGRHSSLDSNHQ